jgi:hypothetical protein
MWLIDCLQLTTSMLTQVDRELELEFIREFAVGGDLLNASSIEDRRERIRVAIYRKNLVHRPFRDSGVDYAQAYRNCYGRPIEMRRVARHQAKIGDSP